MNITTRALFSGFAVIVVAVAQESKPQFTARELFYAASQAPKTPTPAPAKPAAPPAATQAQTVNRTAKRAPSESAALKTPSPAVEAAVLPKVSDLQPQSSDLPARPAGSTSPIVTAATTISMAPVPATGTPLGLRYTILKRSGDEMTEVAPGTVFHSGDAIQFSVQSNGPGYLYIIAQGSSGTWKPLFPSPDVADGNNFVDGWRPYPMPPGSRMVFDETKGTEKIFMVFSREPEQDLEKTIYMLQSGAPKPAGGSAPRQMVASNKVSIDDDTVGKLRAVYARDLIIEKVNPSSSGERKETAVYVVNPTGSAAARVVADVQLVHQ